MAPDRERRTLLGALGVVATALAGCTAPGTADTPTGGETTAADGEDGSDGEDATREDDSDGGDGDSDDGEDEGTTTEADAMTDDEDENDDGTSTTADLDLREANVTGVTVSSGDGGYVFDVTLYHDDDGEDGYANWWQVETLDGERIGRRDLAHPHGTREFTRSNFQPYSVPEGTDCVVVRGHDGTHGYGGQAAIVTLDGGAVRFERQGSEPASFADADCP